jgi:hypothetical protein
VCQFLVIITLDPDADWYYSAQKCRQAPKELFVSLIYNLSKHIKQEQHLKNQKWRNNIQIGRQCEKNS